VSAADSLQNFGFLIRDVSRLSAKNFGRHARELEVTVAQCKVLAYLQRHEGISQTRLAELTETDPMTLVRTLDRMQQDGWIERRADPEDRRAHRLYLLDAARPVLQRIWKIADQSRAEALGALNLAEREQLVSLLQRVHARLSALDAR
jgi:MarR family transcriptional regulator, transcriptional regulator for hemolysin